MERRGEQSRGGEETRGGEEERGGGEGEERGAGADTVPLLGPQAKQPSIRLFELELRLNYVKITS